MFISKCSISTCLFLSYRNMVALSLILVMDYNIEHLLRVASSQRQSWFPVAVFYLYSVSRLDGSHPRLSITF